VDVYAKNIARDAVSCEFAETRMKLMIRDQEGHDEYQLDVELYGKVSLRVRGLGVGCRVQ